MSSISKQLQLVVAMVAILAGCSSTPTIPTQTPTTVPVVDLATATSAPLVPTETSAPTTLTAFVASATPQLPTATLTTPPMATTVLHIIGVRIKSSGCVIAGPLPDSGCTPGAIFVSATTAQICVSGYTKTVRNVSTAERNAVFTEYGVTSHLTGAYEVDHLIALELGGSNDIANLWPEPAAPTPGFHQKDVIENALHARVCSGALSLAEDQWEIATNWLEVYDGGTVVPPRTTPPPAATNALTVAPADTPAPTSAPTSVPTSGLALISVVGGRPGATASAAVQTTPGASCSITYVTPAGTHSVAQGLGPAVADTSGRAAWSWNIGPSTKPGTGTVTVTCNGVSISSPIPIG